MEPLTITKTLGLLLSVTNKAMDLVPNYSQRKKQQFYNLLEAYEREKNLGLDDNLIDNLQDKLIRFITVFEQEIKK